MGARWLEGDVGRSYHHAVGTTRGRGAELRREGALRLLGERRPFSRAWVGLQLS